MSDPSPSPASRRTGAPQASPSEASYPELQNARILVVDDERLVLSVVRRMLERTGAQVVAANSPFEAQQHFDAATEPFDLVLTDIVMPGLDGVDLVSRLHASRPGQPVVFMTGWSSHTSNGASLAGPLVTKPFTSEELLGTLNQVLLQTRSDHD